MQRSGSLLAVRLTALAVAVMAAFAAQAAVTVAGNLGTDPASVLGPGDTVLPGTVAWVGSNGVGSLTVDNGSFLSLARVAFGAGGGTSIGTGLITGSATQVQLVGNGTNNQIHRLTVGDWGTGQLTVSGGALLSTRGNQAPCLLAFHYCDSFVGAAAGDSATLNVTGAGTQVLIGQNLIVAQPFLAVQGLDGYTYGTPGGTTRGMVNVTGGALLSTDRAQIGPNHWSVNATGFERNIAEVKHRRQLIFVTHNPNIPVLGDAERVFVTESDGQHGRLRAWGDVEKVKFEIEQILEGGAEAFLERKRRYGH